MKLLSKKNYVFIFLFMFFMLMAASMCKENKQVYAQSVASVEPRAASSVITISFDALGGTAVTPIQVTTGSSLRALPRTTRYGYIFDGWHTAAVGGTELTLNTVLYVDQTFYAHWIPLNVMHTVYFDSQGGSSVASVTMGDQWTFTNIPESRMANATFEGWYTRPNGQGSRLTTTTRIVSDVIYYAYWTQRKMTGLTAYYSGTAYEGAEVDKGLVVNAIYSDGTMERVYSYTVSTKTLAAGKNLVSVAYNGYQTYVEIIVAQNTNPSGGNANTPGSSTTTPGGSTATPGGNTTTPGGSTTTPGGSNPSGGGQENTSNPSGGGSDESEKPECTVTFHANGGAILAFGQNTVKAGDEIGALPKTMRNNYVLKGWYTQKTGGIKVSKTTQVNKSITLYAHWVKVEKPAKVKSLSVSSKKAGQLKVKFKKVADAAGYQIGYSTKKNFASGTKKILTKSLNKTIKKLKKGKTYYVRVRAYKIDSAGKRVYGAYNTKKTIKIKS